MTTTLPILRDDSLSLHYSSSKNLTSWKNFASFDTLIVIESAKVVEIEIISKIVSLAMTLKSNNPMCNPLCGQSRNSSGSLGIRKWVSCWQAQGQIKHFCKEL